MLRPKQSWLCWGENDPSPGWELDSGSEIICCNSVIKARGRGRQIHSIFWFRHLATTRPALLSKQGFEKILNKVTQWDPGHIEHHFMNWDSQADCLKLLHYHRLKWEAAIHHSLGYLLNLLVPVITLQFLPQRWLLSQNKHDADNCLESLRGCSHNQGGLIQSLTSNSAIILHK